MKSLKSKKDSLNLNHKKMKNKVDIEKATTIIKDTIDEIKSGLETSNLSTEAAARLKEEAIKVELQAYKTKIGLQLHLLAQSHSNLSAKDVLIRMLSLLPNDIPQFFLPILTEYTLENWSLKTGKLAA